ncbi:histidine kinase [Streptomyces sp. Da 82-17]|uniref:sensor histidine kinase n=1 Tax=Streptomyces sp. Da 82-17 TaxID=3377116 RepID=UPI0038D4C75E
MTLYRRIFLLHAAVLVLIALLLLGPVTVSTPVRAGEAVVLCVGLVATITVSAVLLRIGLAPLGRLNRAMTQADLVRPHSGPAVQVTGTGEIAELTAAFNAMLDRLAAERADSTARVLSAQEDERARVARELHDEVGQTLTAVLLQLGHAAGQAPEPLRAELRQAQEATRAGLDEIRRIARRLRPGVLDDLGLTSALHALAAEFTTPTLTVRCRVDAELPPLDAATELVLYRVAQEALTNAARHAQADTVHVHLGRTDPKGPLRLRIRDNGRGLGSAPEGAGIQGMRERALLIGATLNLKTAADPTGTHLTLNAPYPTRTTR